VECSAKTGHGVPQAVYTLLRACLPHVAVKPRDPPPPTVKTKNTKCALQ